MTPVDGLDIALGLSLLDTTVEDLSGLNPWTGETVVRDREMGLAPDVTANGIVRYEWECVRRLPGVAGRLQLRR